MGFSVRGNLHLLEISVSSILFSLAIILQTQDLKVDQE